VCRLSPVRQGLPQEFCAGHDPQVQADIEFLLMRFADVIASLGLCCIFGTALPHHSVRRPLHLYLGALDEIKNDVEATSDCPSVLLSGT